MRIIRYLFYMILLLSNIGIQASNYSIDILLEYLEVQGYYGLIQGSKTVFGNDVAIEVCKELVQSSDCETVVRVYMTSESGGGGPHKAPAYINPEIYEEILVYFENNYNINEEIEQLIKVILYYNYSFMNKEEMISFIERIIKNPKIIRHLLM